jgi:flagellar biosynthesis chaperone FliJ
MTSLQLLNDYIDKLIKSGELQKYDIQDAKIEQKKIIKEINSIKSSLSNIMGKATNINANINTNINANINNHIKRPTM